MSNFRVTVREDERGWLQEQCSGCMSFVDGGGFVFFGLTHRLWNTPRPHAMRPQNQNPE